jgi:hypothetical protein
MEGAAKSQETAKAYTLPVVEEKAAEKKADASDIKSTHTPEARKAMHEKRQEVKDRTHKTATRALDQALRGKYYPEGGVVLRVDKPVTGKAAEQDVKHHPEYKENVAKRNVVELTKLGPNGELPPDARMSPEDDAKLEKMLGDVKEMQDAGKTKEEIDAIKRDGKALSRLATQGKRVAQERNVARERIREANPGDARPKLERQDSGFDFEAVSSRYRNEANQPREPIERQGAQRAEHKEEVQEVRLELRPIAKEKGKMPDGPKRFEEPPPRYGVKSAAEMNAAIQKGKKGEFGAPVEKGKAAAAEGKSLLPTEKEQQDITLILTATKTNKELDNTIAYKGNAIASDIYTQEKLDRLDMVTLSMNAIIDRIANGNVVLQKGEQKFNLIELFITGSQVMFNSRRIDQMLNLVREKLPTLNPEQQNRVLDFVEMWASHPMNSNSLSSAAFKTLIATVQNEPAVAPRAENLLLAGAQAASKPNMPKIGGLNSDQLFDRVRTGKISSGKKKAAVLVIASDIFKTKASLFSSITAAELTAMANNVKDEKEIPNIASLNDFNERLKTYIYQKVLEGATPEERARTLGFFVDVAHNLIEKGDLDSAANILSAIRDNTIDRLGTTINKLSSSQRESLRDLNEFFSKARQLKDVTKGLNAAGIAHIPQMDKLAGDLQVAKEMARVSMQVVTVEGQEIKTEEHVNLTGSLVAVKAVNDLRDIQRGFNLNLDNESDISKQIYTSDLKDTGNYDLQSRAIRDSQDEVRHKLYE